MKVWLSTDPKPTGRTESLHVYNGLDCCVTLEVLQAIKPQLNEVTGEVYRRALALQAPILEMECRGVRIDRAKRYAVAKLLAEKKHELSSALAEIINDGLGIPCKYVLQAKGPHKGKLYWTGFNPNSPDQLKRFFYEQLGLPPVRNRGQVTCDRKALEKLKSYFHVEILVAYILAIRDCTKKLGVLRTGVDPDGRIRTSYNIAGTDTGRLSSYASAFGSGTNLQNITGELRSIFVADPGHKLCYIDLQQGESFAVGAILWNLFQDGRYLDACEGGDLHTTVARSAFPQLPWTGIKAQDKKVAEQPFYRHFSYRDMAKRLGHGTNYHGQPPHMAKAIGVTLPIVQEFQRQYLASYGMDRWHEWVRTKLIRDGWITSFMGRFRFFFGRRYDNDTLNAAIAYEPQSAIAEYLNRGLFHTYKANLPVQLLLQVHDAIVFQYREELENEVVPAVQALLEHQVPLLHDRTLSIPNDAMIGWNWGYASAANPDGLVKFKGQDDRQRSAPVSLVSRVMGRTY